MIIFLLSAFGLICALGVAGWQGYKKGYHKGQADLLLLQSRQQPIQAATLMPGTDREDLEYFPKD